MYFHVRFQGWKKTLKGAILRPRSSWWIWFVSRAFRVWTMHLWRLKKCGCVFKMGHYIPIQWIKLVTLVETCCSMAWYSIVRQTQLTDIGWRNLNLSGELGSSPQKSQTQGRNVRWCEISKSFVYHAKKPSRSGFYTPKTLAHMFSQRSVAQYGVILQGHQTWLARKPLI